MVLSDCAPDEDILLKCALRLYATNDMLFEQSVWSSSDILNWQRYMFDFGLHMTYLFKVDVSTKLDRLMRDHHLTLLG